MSIVSVAPSAAAKALDDNLGMPASQRNRMLLVGMSLLMLLATAGALAPWLGTVDPLALNPVVRLQNPSAEHWFGTDMLGRDIYSRVVYGARYSLMIGVSVAFLSAAIGAVIGLVTGFNRTVDAIVMRIIDGLMAIPAILIAIGLMSVANASAQNVIVAITVAEAPRVIRLVRGVTLALRAQTFVEAATASGTSAFHILTRHILPNIVSPLVVQTTFIFSAAMLIEAALSFIGAGIPPEIPTWGNIIAEGRNAFLISQNAILFPGAVLAASVLTANLIGDGLRDYLDPRHSEL